MAGVALKNTELFPVRCCSQDIPVKQVVSTLMNAERTTYISRSEEHAVPPSERWYCPQTKCGQWIRPRYLKAGPRGLRCPHCRSFICIKCRDIAHEDRDCETDPMLMEVLNVARHQRWQRCYNCHTMVEKTSGCNHMKCACAAEFWYVHVHSELLDWEILTATSYSCSRRWPCHCRGTTEVVDDAGRLEEDPALDTTMVVAAMEQAERELTEREVADVVTEYEQFEMQRPLSNEAPSQAETRPIWPPGMMWFMEDLAHRIPAGSR
ncbi:hypothetical protein N7512_003958 [Penicillium capsulatum]|nr:hypothetical protein N7512_003958 [Penicillium capsulatum]